MAPRCLGNPARTRRQLEHLTTLSCYVPMGMLAALLGSVLLTWAQIQPRGINLTIIPSSLQSTPGGTLNVMGTITNHTGVPLDATDLFLNFSAYDPNAMTPTQLLGTRDFSLPNSTTSPAVILFSVTTGFAVPSGTYPLDIFFQDINNNSSNVVTTNLIVQSTPFGAFSVRVEVNAASMSFDVKSRFTVGPGGSIAPPTQDVTFQLGGYSVTIPAGSFRLHERDEGDGLFIYERGINGVLLEAEIKHLGGGNYSFMIEGAGAPNLPTENPVTVGLAIGSNAGSTMVNADFGEDERNGKKGGQDTNNNSGHIVNGTWKLAKSFSGAVGGRVRKGDWK